MVRMRPSKGDWLKRREALEDIYIRCMGGFPERRDLEPEVVREETTDEFVAQWLRYTSEPGERVPGLLVRPRRAQGRLPVIIVVPGGHRTKDFAVFGHEEWPLPFEIESPHHRFPTKRIGNPEPLPFTLLLKHGFAIMSTDARTFGARAGWRPEREKDLAGEFTKASWAEMQILMHRAIVDGRSVAGMETWDIIRGIDYLETLDDIDTGRIGCTGWSMGGNLAWMTAITEPRIKAVCTVSCMITYDAALKYGRDKAPYGWIPGIRKHTSRQELLSMLAPRPLLVFEGDDDMPVEGRQPMVEEARSKYELLGAADGFRLEMYHGGHAACLREQTTYDQIGRWFQNWLR